MALFTLKPFYLDEAGDGGGDAGGGGSEAGTTDAGTSSSAIATNGESEATFEQSLPEELRVYDGEGDERAFNLESSARKLLEQHNTKQTDSNAPETPEGYDIDGVNLGEGVNTEEFMKDEGTQSFLKRMHAKGLTNEQVKEVLEYGLNEWAPNLMEGTKALTADESLKHLSEKVWTDPAEYKQNRILANTAYRSLPDELQQSINQGIGNDPVFMQVMAIFGKEMGEDRPPSGQATSSDQQTIEQLQMSEAYKNEKHPDHERVSKQVKSYYEKLTGGK